MRTSNPKRFYGKFRKRKKNVKNKISMEQFVDHFKTSFLTIVLKPLSGPNLSAKTTIYTHYK
jgi:hypothetical protein